MAYRYFGGSYTYLAPHCDTSWPWKGNTDIGPGPHPYDGTSAMSDGDVTLNPTNQTYDANPSQVSFPDPDDSMGPGHLAAWWGNANSDRFPAILLDLGREVKINAIAAIANLRYSTFLTLSWFRVKGSHDGVNWVTLLSEETNLPGEASDPAMEPDSGLGESYKGIFVRPAKRKIGMFYAPGIGPDALDTVTYRYLQFEISRVGTRENTDSTAISEIIIDAVPEPATVPAVPEPATIPAVPEPATILVLAGAVVMILLVLWGLQRLSRRDDG
jgi:hypothetical protein